MRMLRSSLVFALALLVAAPASQAQTHVIGRAGLEQAVRDRAERDRADRDVILSVLRRAEVKDIVERAGLPLERAEAGVAMLHGEDLQQAASHARQVQSDLAGGGNITISTTTIIIILLLVILIVVIAN
jgi:hypothetical protein